jgi:hypothetical protein
MMPGDQVADLGVEQQQLGLDQRPFVLDRSQLGA